MLLVKRKDVQVRPTTKSDRAVKSAVEDAVAAEGIVPTRRQDLNKQGIALLDEIMAYRNESVIERYMTDNSASRQEAEIAYVGLLQFLVLSVFNKGNHTPSKIIDEMWHCFILHMRDYEEFCKKYLRQVVYHDPAHDDNAFKYYSVARNCVIELFGEADEQAWPLEHTRYLRCISCPPVLAFLFGDCMLVQAA